MRSFPYGISELYVEAGGEGRKWREGRTPGPVTANRPRRTPGSTRPATAGTAIAPSRKSPGTPAAITATGGRTTMARLRVSDDPAPR